MTTARRRVTHWATELTALMVGVALLLLLADALPEDLFSPSSRSFFFAIGLIGLWRYSWWGLHLARAIWYNARTFPRLRRHADAAALTERPDELYILCTSFRLDPAINFAVYRAMFQEAVALGVPTTILASLSDRSDVEAIEHALEACGSPAGIELRYLFQKGDGKRSAMGDALRAISRCMPSSRALVVLMDGDVYLEPGTLSRSVSFFAADPGLGALTTNNQATVRGGDVTRAWYALRYAQRHLMMSSLSLSRRLLVLTGRFSVFRAEATTQPGFIELVENDSLDHWRLGRFKFLSGDDKSTWFWLLQRGYAMRYLPDVFVTGFEELPDRRRFFASTRDLMQRWFGNMLRTNGRAIRLGPAKMGFFTWWCLVDQRLSMWTTLMGPTIAIMLALFMRPSFLLTYLLWILFTRSVTALVLGLQSGRFSLLWIPLLYYNQLIGALIKTYVSFRLNRQSWSRQGISSGEPEDPVAVRRQRRLANVIHGVVGACLLLVISYGVHVLVPPDRLTVQMFAHELQRSTALRQALDERWLVSVLSAAPSESSVSLPSGRLYVGSGLAKAASALPDRQAQRLTGNGTTLVLEPEIARLIRATHPLEVQGDRIDCALDASCTLQLGEISITLHNVTLELMAAPSQRRS
ncbi:glycosyltransferase [Halomonas saccharevitans]|uniref:Glycosyltransferase Alg8 n=1 Tax=Halomonas saccharevitans TaxID=416872 RepID=A0A1I7C3K4_9GAMM|nr:glycosyltransferase [Halomonas saccharevitans]SFT93964.1 glycosyltransferase Alg8 [Halomonas saccharevitans]